MVCGHIRIVTSVQGDQKVSVYLIITIQKLTSNVQIVPPPVSRHLLTHRTVFSKTVFSIARSTFRMYSVMAIFISSIVYCTVIVRCTENFWSPCFRRKVHYPSKFLKQVCPSYINVMLHNPDVTRTLATDRRNGKQAASQEILCI